MEMNKARHVCSLAWVTTMAPSMDTTGKRNSNDKSLKKDQTNAAMSSNN